MKSKNLSLKYVKVDKNNIDIAFNIQKEIWPSSPDYENFLRKINLNKQEESSFIVFYDDIPIGITGTYVESIDDETIWLDWYGVLKKYRGKGFGKDILEDTINYCTNLNNYNYLRLDTTFWKGRPAINLYDIIMDLKEEYTVEDTETKKYNTIIYTYNLKKTNYTKPWNNKFLGLNEYYENCK